MHPKYFATIGLPYQIQSACRTWERFSATLGFSTQTQSAIKEFESISSKFGLAAQIQGAWKDIESLSSRLGLTQFQSAWKDVERLSSWMGLPHFQSASKDFWGFSSRLGLSPQFRSAAKDFESFSKFGFLQSAAKDLSLAERVGVVGLASGLMGPTAAARAIAHLSEGSFKDTVLADLIGQMEGIVGAEAGDGDGGRDDAASMLFILKKRIFDGVQWAELNPRIREWLKIHYVSLLLFFLSTAITLFIREESRLFAIEEERASRIQFEEAVESERIHDAEATRKFDVLKQSHENLRAMLEQVLEYENAHAMRDDADNGSSCPVMATSVDAQRRFTTRATRAHLQPKGGSPVAARLPQGEIIYVFQHRRRWLYIGYCDIIAGHPITGWVRKKYTQVVPQGR